MLRHGKERIVGASIHLPREKIGGNACFFILLAVALLGIAVAYAASSVCRITVDNEQNTTFPHAWQYRVGDGAFSEVTLPASIDVSTDAHLTLKNQLPMETIIGGTLLLRTSQQDVAVYVAGEEIYSSYDPEKQADAPSSAYHFVRLPIDYAGKEVTVVLRSPYAHYAGLMNAIYIGSKTAHLLSLVCAHGLRWIVGFLIFSIGLLLIFVFSCARGQQSRAAIIYLGAFLVCAGYWMMVESGLTQFIIPYPMALTNSSIFTLTLFPVFLGLYYDNAHKKVFQRAGRYIIVLTALPSLLLAIIACVWPRLPLRILPFYMWLMVCYVAVIVGFILVESVREAKFFSAPIFGVCAFGVCGLLELALYLSDVKAYNDEANLVTLGLILFCIAMVMDALQNFARIYQAAIKVDTLSVLAYTDSLTGLKNRTAFLERLSTIDVKAEAPVSVAMFDINNLKQVNDTLGHLAGDAMLVCSVKAIKRNLRKQDALYRIGGDEFVAILCRNREISLDCLAHRMDAIAREENQRSSCWDISIAYGYATFAPEIDQSLFETLARADEKMYACKKKQKKSR